MLCKKCKKEIQDDAVFCAYCGVSQAMQERKAKSRGNGTGTIFKLPSGKWKAEVVSYYYMKDGKQKKKRKTKVFEKRKDAVNAISSLKGSQSKEDITLQVLHDLFITTKHYEKLSKSQMDKLGYAWDRCEAIQSRKISELTVDDMQTTIDSKVSTYYPARDMKVILSHLYVLAIQREYVAYNKTEYIELPDFAKAKKDAFNEDEIQKFWNDYEGREKDGTIHLDQQYLFTGYILIMIYVGLRYGEMSTILKENVFFDEKYMIGGIKSEAGIDRVLAIPDKVIPVVKAFYDKGRKKLLEMNEDNFYAAYWETIKRLEVRELVPHCCRHTFFTRLALADIQPAIITEMGGHKDYNVTMGYTHIPLKDKLEAANKI